MDTFNYMYSQTLSIYAPTCQTYDTTYTPSWTSEQDTPYKANKLLYYFSPTFTLIKG